jgi:hypothetical protein
MAASCSVPYRTPARERDGKQCDRPPWLARVLLAKARELVHDSEGASNVQAEVQHAAAPRMAQRPGIVGIDDSPSAYAALSTPCSTRRVRVFR